MIQDRKIPEGNLAPETLRAAWRSISYTACTDHPDVFMHAAAAMMADPSRVAVVEDTPSGVTAAVAAGMRAFGYAAGSDATALRRAGAEVFHVDGGAAGGAGAQVSRRVSVLFSPAVVGAGAGVSFTLVAVAARHANPQTT